MRPYQLKFICRFSDSLGLSSCFILLGTSLLYANSGTTNMDSLYVITSISDLNNGGFADGNS
ncbi:hypothetical protein GCM10023329_58570 [Streptomyces sanyensis]|uniref:Uncharacterized protein n=1 Tax=Streptomyces sanyensis TaxID=568869 RepID=A0ABP9BPZ1_9ACTN